MSYSQNLALGEIAYDGFHAVDDEYKQFDKLAVSLQERWAQGARNACDAWTKAGGVDVEAMRTATREAHASMRAKERAKHRYHCWVPDFYEPEDGIEVEAHNDGFAACDYAHGLYRDPSLCDISDKLVVHVRATDGKVTRFQVHCVIHAEDAPPEDEDPGVTK